MVASTACPKPTANTLIPLALSAADMAMACASPPYSLLCLPSVRTITTRVATLALTFGPVVSSSCATRRPSEMLVLPRSSSSALMALVAVAAELVRSVRTLAAFAKRTTATCVPVLELVSPVYAKDSATSYENCLTWSIHARIEPEQSMTRTSSSVASHDGASGGAGGDGPGQKEHPHASGQRNLMIGPYVACLQ